jgi:DNA repair exonuclease SbcCD ATPase subunit
MAKSKVSTDPVTLHVKNVGGISETTVELTPGVSILAGRNATNRTSLLKALMAALGSDEVAVKGNADEGLVEMTIGDRTFTRRLYREDGRTRTEGDPYLADATLANLFVFLLETNDARQAVAMGEDLREIIMEPVDTSEIEAEIRRYQSQREEVEAELAELRQLQQQLPGLERESAELGDEIETKRDELATVEADIEQVDEDVDEKRGEKRELDARLEDLNDVRSELESVRRELDTQESSLEALHEERAELESEYEDYEDVPDDRLDAIEANVERLRNEKENMTSSLDELQSVIEFNENLLEGNLDLFDDVDADDGAITDELLEDSDDVVCWTCGSRTDTSQIESMVDDLRDLYSRYMDKRSELDAQIDDLTDERLQIEEKRRQRMQIEDQLAAITDEVDQRETRFEELSERRNELTEQVEALEVEVEELQSEADQESELLELHKEANRLEVEIDRLADALESTEAEIDRIEERLDERERLKSRDQRLKSDIEDLRTRVERLEEDAITQFNDHMESLLEILDYDNLERIWIERTEEEVREGRKKITKGRFDLHIVRSTDDGAVYEDTVDHLSESEREVTGLVFALAGYLVHDVHEEVSFMLLDSVETIDAPRIAELVDYFQAHTDYFVVALLEEDAQALDDDYQRVTDI